MLPLPHDRTHLLMGASQDTRPPPAEFAEMFASIVHVVHTSELQNQPGKIDGQRVQALAELARAALTAQVFDFGDIPEPRLMGEAITGGDLMGQKLLRLPYPSVLYWYTLTELVDHGKEKFYLKDMIPRLHVDRVRYATLVAEAGEDFYVADFLLLDPETAAQARRSLIADGIDGTLRKSLDNGKHLFLCSGIARMTATETKRWKGYLLDRPGGEGTDEQLSATLGSLADGVAAMTMILATKGVGVRREPAPAKVNAKREKAGKPPYPSVTHVDARQYFDAMQRTALGGTHASPVPHLRRGHVRRYEDGRKTWVRSCLVNCTSLAEAQTRDHYDVVTA